MLIGEICKKTGLSKDTVRFYEKQGLISLDPKQRRGNNYKEYSDETLNRLLTIKRIKGFGFTLNETLDMLDMIDTNTASCNNVSEKVSEKVLLIEKKIAELMQLKQQMIDSVNNCYSSCTPKSNENCPALTTDIIPHA